MASSNSKGLHIALWVVQVLLAGMFFMAGSTKLFQPIEALTQNMPWVADVPSGMVRFIGLSQVLGSLGLLLPSLLRIQPKLTVVAAYCLALVMLLAAGFHISRGEFNGIGPSVVLMAVSLFLAWGRSKRAPIAACTR